MRNILTVKVRTDTSCTVGELGSSCGEIVFSTLKFLLLSIDGTTHNKLFASGFNGWLLPTFGQYYQLKVVGEAAELLLRKSVPITQV